MAPKPKGKKGGKASEPASNAAPAAPTAPAPAVPTPAAPLQPSKLCSGASANPKTPAPAKKKRKGRVSGANNRMDEQGMYLLSLIDIHMLLGALAWDNIADMFNNKFGMNHNEDTLE
ncbi:hypothetical protein FRC08_014206 [Ceratobasidium sp. 394]|nr:hypothetical protein FRC08_014206 [Ceratobasidium sp. 394]